MSDDNAFQRNLYVLEDDDAVREAIVELLRLNEFDPVGFARPEAMLEAYDGEPGCLLLDLHLPHAENGLSYARRIIADRLPLTLVIMTGSADPEERRIAAQLNPAAMLLKPFSEAALLDAMDCAALRSRENVCA